MTTRSTDEETKRGFPLLRYFIVGTGFLFLAIAGFYVAENLAGERAWEKEKARLAAAGESLDIADFFPDPSSVPDEENGATVPIFVESFSNPSGSRFDETFVFDTIGFGSAEKGSQVRGKAPDFESIAKALKNSPPTGLPTAQVELAHLLVEALAVYDADSAEIDEAHSRPHFNPPLREKAPLRVPHDAIPLIIDYTQMLSLRATCHMATGQYNEAFLDVNASFRAIDFLSSPLLVPFLITTTTIHIGIRPLWFGLALSTWTAAELKQLEQQLAAIDLNSRLVEVLLAERAIFCTALDAFEKDRDNAANGLAMLFDFTPGVGLLPMTLDEVIEKTLIQIAPKGWFRWNQVTQSHDTDFVIRSFLSSPHGSPPSISRSKPSPYTCVADQMISSINLVCVRARHTEAILAQARTAIALELFRQSSGHLPSSLAELSPAPPPDPITGAPLLYERVDDTRYKLWSVALNGLDDGGETGPSETTRKALDWVWQSWITEEDEKSSE